MKGFAEDTLITWKLDNFLHFIICLVFVSFAAGCAQVQDDPPAVGDPQPVSATNGPVSVAPPTELTQSRDLPPTVPPPSLPRYPWPPEKPSWLIRLDQIFPAISHEQSLFDVSEILSQALQGAKYNQIGYFGIPGGFVMLTRLEGIDENGYPLGDNRRYQLPDDKRDFSLREYISRLFFAPEGYYRFIAFVVSDAIYTAGENALSEATALDRLAQGAPALSSDFRGLKFSPDHRIDALIYEFRKSERDKDVQLMQPGRLEPATHLENSGLVSAFNQVLQLQ